MSNNNKEDIISVDEFDGHSDCDDYNVGIACGSRSIPFHDCTKFTDRDMADLKSLLLPLKDIEAIFNAKGAFDIENDDLSKDAAVDLQSLLSESNNEFRRFFQQSGICLFQLESDSHTIAYLSTEFFRYNKSILDIEEWFNHKKHNINVVSLKSISVSGIISERKDLAKEMVGRLQERKSNRRRIFNRWIAAFNYCHDRYEERDLVRPFDLDESDEEGIFMTDTVVVPVLSPYGYTDVEGGDGARRGRDMPIIVDLTANNETPKAVATLRAPEEIPVITIGESHSNSPTINEEDPFEFTSDLMNKDKI